MPGTETTADEPMNLEQSSTFLKQRVSEEAIRKALARGDLKGRNFGGSVGWMTTKGSLIEWIRDGNVTSKEGEASDDDE